MRQKETIGRKCKEGNPRNMWQGRRTMTNNKGPAPSLSSADDSLVSELNNFYACFQANCSHQAKTTDAEVAGWKGAPSTPITLSKLDVRRAFTRKIAGPDCISGWVLKLCADTIHNDIQPIPGSVCHTYVPQ